MSEAIDIVKGSKLEKTIKAAFSDYRKRKVFMTIFDTDERLLNPSLGGWNGGSCDYDTMLDMSGGIARTEHVSQSQPSGKVDVEKVKIDENHAKVTTGTFCGKPSTMSISCTKTFFERHLK